MCLIVPKHVLIQMPKFQFPVSNALPGSESLGELVGDLRGVHLDGGDDVDEDVVAVRLLSHRVAVRNLELAKDLKDLQKGLLLYRVTILGGNILLLN